MRNASNVVPRWDGSAAGSFASARRHSNSLSNLLVTLLKTQNLLAHGAAPLLTDLKSLYCNLRTLYRRATGVTPNLNVCRHSYKLIRLGSSYGGWSFVETGSLYNSAIISCGLGEDASFDVEFASRFHSKVIVVDPTPRAVLHFNQIVQRIGSRATMAYSDSGNQLAEAYDLSALTPNNLILVDKALWNESKTLRFYMPKNPHFVSHSLVNYQNGYCTDTNFMEVNAISIDVLVHDFGLRDIPLLKLDIEGAEIEVLVDMLGKKIFPAQILLEYDEFTSPSKLSKARIETAHAALLNYGYRLINIDYPSNFLYIRM